MDDKIKLGVIGGADIAKRHLLPNIKNHDKFVLHGIASRDTEKGNNLANTFSTKYYANYLDLINSNIDCVYIPLPNGLHYKWAKLALEKGLHVLVEKSLACTFNDVFELNKIAKKKNLSLVENFQFRFHNQLKIIYSLVDKGEIGDIRQVRSSFGFPPFRDKDNIRYNKLLGGGALLDAGAYTVKISQLFLKNKIFVASSSLNINKEQKIDTWGSAYLKQMGSAVTSQISFGFENFYQNELQIWGSLGNLKCSRVFTASPDVDPSIIIEKNDVKTIHNLPRDNHFKGMLDYFYTSIMDDDKKESEYAENNEQARIISEIREKSL